MSILTFWRNPEYPYCAGKWYRVPSYLFVLVSYCRRTGNWGVFKHLDTLCPCFYGGTDEYWRGWFRDNNACLCGG